MKTRIITIATISLFLFFSNSCPAQDEYFIEDISNYKTNAIEFQFFSPLNHNLTFGFERWIKKGLLLESQLGLTGVGFDWDLDVLSKRGIGFLTTFGPKLMLGKNFYMKGMRERHPLAGTYFKPEVAFTYYTKRKVEHSQSGQSFGRNDNVVSAALLLNMGSQFVISEIITLDIHGGLGYGFATDSDDNSTFYYSHILLGDSPLAFSYGFSLGVLIK